MRFPLLCESRLELSAWEEFLSLDSFTQHRSEMKTTMREKETILKSSKFTAYSERMMKSILPGIDLSQILLRDLLWKCSLKMRKPL